MYLGIEIGGTKLQLGVGRGDGSPLVALERRAIAAEKGAAHIRQQIHDLAAPLIAQHRVGRIGIGFGGPVDSARGRVIKSHHVEGWVDFPILQWCRDTLRLDAALANDADVAGLAEARFGAGRGLSPVFYITVGTGIGGGLIIDGHIYSGAAGAAEIGHLRPWLSGGESGAILETLAAGPGIARAAQRQIVEIEQADSARFTAARELMARSGGDLQRIDARLIGEAAQAGNSLAREVLEDACRALGWAIAQVVTLLSPRAVVIGGGVSLIGEQAFFGPVRRAVDEFVFPPFRETFQILPAALGEEVVVHGALALAASDSKGG